MAARQLVTAFVPTGLDLPALAAEAGVDARWVHALVGLLYERRVTSPRKARRFVRLHSHTLRDLLGSRHYKRVVDAMAARGMIEVDRRYIKGERSGGSVGPAVALGRPRRAEAWAAPRPLADPVHRRLAEQLGRVSVADGYGHLPADAVLALDALRAGRRFACCCAYGRFHSNLTNLKKERRAYLRVDGLALVNLMPMGTGYLTPREAAERARVSPSLIYTWCAERRLAHARVGAEGKRGRILIRPADLDALLSEYRVGRHPLLKDCG